MRCANSVYLPAKPLDARVANLTNASLRAAMKYVYCTGLIDFKISEKLSVPLELRERTYITNNPAHIEKYLRQEDVLAIGQLEADLLLNGSPVIYRLDKVSKKEDAHIELINFLRDVQAFLASLWLATDNSANCELAFAISQGEFHVHSNSLVLQYSTSVGNRTVLDLGAQQLRDVAEIFKSFTGVREQDRLPHTIFQKETGRQNVSTLFLQQARSSQDLGLKIANYCSFFESLLSTNSTELAHQLSERAAFMLRDSPVDRLQHFRDTKRAYAIRSKVVHGDVVSNKQVPDLLEVSTHCDQAAREIFQKILDDEELGRLFSSGSNQDLDEFMLRKVFGIDGKES